MSYNNVTPWWVILVESELKDAKMLLGFDEEIKAGFTRSYPNHIIELIKYLNEDHSGH